MMDFLTSPALLAELGLTDPLGQTDPLGLQPQTQRSDLPMDPIVMTMRCTGFEEGPNNQREATLTAVSQPFATLVVAVTSPQGADSIAYNSLYEVTIKDSDTVTSDPGTPGNVQTSTETYGGNNSAL
jgi:hypothetical protein